jgi:hypothetical protein
LYIGAVNSTADTAPALDSSSWYLITGKASSGSALPTNLTTGMVFKQLTSDLPVDSTAAFSSNDAVKKITLTKAAFVTDVSVSVSKEKFEETVQTDDVRSYQVSSKPEKTGTISGYWIDNDSKQREIVKKLDTVTEQTTTGGITKTSPQTSILRMFMSRVESSEDTAAAQEIWEYLPAIVEGLTGDKPMEGPETFSFNYTARGADKPATIYIDV